MIPTYLKTISLFLAFLAITGVASAQTNLLQSSAVVAAGSYTYYARGYSSGSNYTNITSFKTPFFPGYSTNAAASHGGAAANDEGYPHTVDASTPPTALPFRGMIVGDNTTYPKLADGNNSTGISGFVGVVSSTGYFDVLIDLGAVFNISQVTLNYTDSSGHRWIVTPAAQSVYTAVTLSATPLDSDFTCFASEQFSSAVSQTNRTFTCATGSVMARYIDLRLGVTVGTSPTGGSYGGVLNDVSVVGTPVTR